MISWLEILRAAPFEGGGARVLDDHLSISFLLIMFQ